MRKILKQNVRWWKVSWDVGNSNRRKRKGDGEGTGMKCWRKRAADIFAKYGIITAKMKLAPGSVPSVFLAGIFTKAFLRLNPGLLRFLDRGDGGEEWCGAKPRVRS